MKKKKVTIHHIAEKLNITASTVARALKDNPRISKATKLLVQKTAQKLNYQPNNIAAALRNGRTNIIGVMIPTADRSFFSSVIRGLQTVANASRYKVMICQTYDDYAMEVDTIDTLLNARVDGIIASLAKETVDFEHFKKLKKRDVPLILFDRTNDALEVSHVVIDDYLGGYKATEHLIEQGYKRIAHFTSTYNLSIYKDRLRGYRDALIAHDLPYHESLVIKSNLQLEDGREGMLQLLQLKKTPDAVFSASALGAIGAMQILKEKGIKIPAEVGLVGFSNESFTSFTDPTLTTVDQHSETIGSSAARIFLEEINNPKGFVRQKIVLKPELIIRQSSLRK